jgi:hypothetical protein
MSSMVFNALWDQLTITPFGLISKPMLTWGYQIDNWPISYTTKFKIIYFRLHKNENEICDGIENKTKMKYVINLTARK